MMNEDQKTPDPVTSTASPVSDTLPPASPSPDPVMPQPPAPAGEFHKEPDEAPAEPPKKRGRPKGSTTRAKVDPLSVTPNPTPRNLPPPIAAPAPIAADYDALGKVAANLWFNGGTLFFGADWQPDTAQGEHLVVKDAFRDYFASTGVTRIPPDVQLFIVLGGYTLARAQKPTVRSKLERAWQWTKAKLSRAE